MATLVNPLVTEPVPTTERSGSPKARRAAWAYLVWIVARSPPVIGNSVTSLASLLRLSPIGAVFSHIAMHSAAVLRGIETTVQLPPDYLV